ncbi:uncharacterized protein RAG0_01970 [Rhynchosporium agropyri]|uniref:Uncharacterized protein n=1 Tax=Rhynchosporium agropyri TaxID=914238 RepID=A0A1E1JZG7_9HELO|nr:uncharacterized protein RAG0_01970 [Rhynchosporium agropyri]
MEFRNFDEVNVENFSWQLGRNRVREHEDGRSLRIAHWRNNLTALSHDFDLYFVACGDKIHITKPRNLYQSIPLYPDLVIGLPRSIEAHSVGGYIDPIHPHDVNNMKVGKLGNREILLIVCDDGDVLAYYTRPLSMETELVISDVQPFVHENVGKSAWGLAIHQHSRLIAVGTNLREVHVFAFAINFVVESDSQEEPTGGEWPARSLSDSTSPFGTVSKLDLRSNASEELGAILERKDCRLKLPLGRSGSNIPSVDFVSDENGEACIVLATDVNGKLWSLDLAQRETLKWPEIHREPVSQLGSDDVYRPRGWGVLCIPISYFMRVQSPQEALGIKNLQFAIKLNTESSALCFQSLDISSSIATVGKNSIIHPCCDHFINRPQAPNTLRLESSPPLPPTRPELSWPDVRSYVIKLLQNFESTKCMVQQPTMIPGYQSNDWVSAMITLLSSKDWYSEAVGKWVYEIYDRVKIQWREGEGFYEAVSQLKFLLRLPPVARYHISTLDKLQQSMVGGLQMATLQNSQLSKTQLASIAKKSQAIPWLQEGQMAVIRTSDHDLELIPPNPNMLSTICRNFIQQTLPRNIQAVVERYERLNMFAVVPELSLLLVASERGRVGLFTLTRLDDDFADVGPVLMFRLDRILPFTEQERNIRHFGPLLGMAVGPLQGKDKDGGVQRKIWRLILHFEDQTILSYELSRGHGPDGLEVF